MLINIFFDGIKKGPFTVSQVREMLYRGDVTFGQPVLIEGQKQQVYLSQISEFHNDIRRIQQTGIRNASQQQPPSASKSSSKAALVIVCVVIGSCGLCGLLATIGNLTKPKIDTVSRSSTTSPTASAASRRQLAAQLQSTFDGYDEVSIYTKGDGDEVLYIGFAGFSARDKAKADDFVDRFRSKTRGYGFKRIEFGDGLQTFWSYNLNQ